MYKFKCISCWPISCHISAGNKPGSRAWVSTLEGKQKVASREQTEGKAGEKVKAEMNKKSRIKEATPSVALYQVCARYVAHPINVALNEDILKADWVCAEYFLRPALLQL